MPECGGGRELPLTIEQRAAASGPGRTIQRGRWIALARRYGGRGKVPKRVANVTAARAKEEVRDVRTRLEANTWAQVGVPAIAWSLQSSRRAAPGARAPEISRVLA